MKQLEEFLVPLGWGTSPLHGYPKYQLCIYLFAYLVERKTVRIRFLAKEHDLKTLGGNYSYQLLVVVV